jgi:hypothetical protein
MDLIRVVFPDPQPPNIPMENCGELDSIIRESAVAVLSKPKAGSPAGPSRRIFALLGSGDGTSLLDATISDFLTLEGLTRL